MIASQKSSLLLAVDPSLTSSGWALFCLDTGHIQQVGLIKAPGPGLSLSQRLELLQRDISALIQDLNLSKNDYLVCEGPAQVVINPKTTIKVEQVRSIFEAIARSYNVNVPGRINPRTVHVELLGIKGKQLERSIVKFLAKETALKLYKAQLEDVYRQDPPQKIIKIPQDILDALLIGTVAVTRIKFCRQSGFEISESLEATKGGSGLSNKVNRTVRNSRGNRKSWERHIEQTLK